MEWKQVSACIMSNTLTYLNVLHMFAKSYREIILETL